MYFIKYIFVSNVANVIFRVTLKKLEILYNTQLYVILISDIILVEFLT